MDLYYKALAWKTEREIKQLEKEQLDRGTARNQILAFLANPDDLDNTKDGWYININGGEKQPGGRVAQAIIIGLVNEHGDIGKGYDDDYDSSAVDEMIRLSATENTSILYGHLTVPIAPVVQSKMLDNGFRDTNVSEHQSKDGKNSSVSTEVNKENKKDLKNHVKNTFRGTERYYNFGVAAAVIARTKGELIDVMESITANLDEAGIRWALPRHNMKRTLLSIIPSNFIDHNLLQPLTGDIVAKMSPLRALNPYFTEGIILGRDDTGKLVRADFNLQDAGHSFIMGKTGAGKTVFECTWAARARGHGHRVLMLNPKDEKSGGTDFKNFCKAYEGKLIRYPESAPNLFQVFYDSKIMGTSQAAHDKAVLDHYETMKGTMAGWIGSSFKNRKKGMFIKTVSDLWRKKGLIDKKGKVIISDNFEDPLSWPDFDEWYNYIKDLNEKKFDPSLNALLYDTIEATEGCALNWISNHNSPELDNDLIIIDISALPLNLQNAFSVLTMGMINTRFFTAEDVEQRRTFVFFDEGAKLLKINELKPFIEKMFRESRSACITTVFATQDPEGIGEDVLNFIKANCSNIFLLCNLKDSVIDRFVKVFSLKESHKERLREEGYGISLYLKHPYAVSMDIDLEDMVENALLSGQKMPKKVNQKVEQKPTFAIDEDVRWIYEEHGFFMEDWTSGLNSKDIPGWTCSFEREALRNASSNVFFETSMIKKAEKEGHQDKIGPEGLKHYNFTCQTAGGMSKVEYFGMEIHHSNDVDISGYLISSEGQKVTVGVEIEMPNTHTTDKQLQDKRDAAREKYDIVIFSCPSDMEKRLINALGEGFVFPRGGKLKKRLEELKVMYPGNLIELTQPMEALQTAV
jgi:hypothetical protein